MNKEVEIQVKIKNSKEAEKKLRKIGRHLGIQRQIDKYFVPPDRDFFAIDPMKEYLRIRFEKGKNHISYFFLNFDKKNPYKLISTDEYEAKVENPTMVKKIFEKVGLIFKITVEKERKYFDCGNFIVSLDKVKGLGNFIEVEAKKIIKNIKNTKRLCSKFLKDLKIDYEFNPKKAGYTRMLYYLKTRKKI